MLKVPNWPGKLTGLSGTFSDRPAKVTNCMVIFPAQSVCHHIQSGLPYLGQAVICDTDRPVASTDKAGSVTNRPFTLL